MAHAYQAVGWNPQKKRYDKLVAGAVLAYLVVFAAVQFVFSPDVTFETVLIRGSGTGAFVLLHLVLVIGPLCRLDPRFLPLLYNRRHLGVSLFALALVHGGFSLIQFHAGGNVNPLVSLLSSNPRVDDLAQFPFQPLGLAALGILFLMAATSHDFWLANLTPPVWKALHMLVYVAYGLVVMHVVLGTLQAETAGANEALLLVGMTAVFGLHLASAVRERRGDRERAPGGARGAVGTDTADGFVDVCAVDDIAEGRAHVACLSGERVAVFRHAGSIAALSNACQHQNGPLGEGRIIDGCITCPWHGYQYRPEDGRSPPPFNERVPTFRARVSAGRVLVHPTPLPAGTAVTPATIDGATTSVASRPGAPPPEEPNGA